MSHERYEWGQGGQTAWNAMGYHSGILYLSSVSHVFWFLPSEAFWGMEVIDHELGVCLDAATQTPG